MVLVWGLVTLKHGAALSHRSFPVTLIARRRLVKFFKDEATAGLYLQVCLGISRCLYVTTLAVEPIVRVYLTNPPS